jgi:hypothetical protein
MKYKELSANIVVSISCRRYIYLCLKPYIFPFSFSMLLILVSYQCFDNDSILLFLSRFFFFFPLFFSSHDGPFHHQNFQISYF